MRIILTLHFLWLAVYCGGQTLSDSATISSDRGFLTFGRIYKAAPPDSMSFSNPHKVAQYAFYKCSRGQTKELLNEMGYVETDTALGKAFLTFLKEFGPDLERYKKSQVYLKFYGYFKNKTTTVWYYYLVDKTGHFYSHKPWISLHRAIETGQCALTGIFLHYPKEKDNPMPKNLITTKVK